MKNVLMERLNVGSRGIVSGVSFPSILNEIKGYDAKVLFKTLCDYERKGPDRLLQDAVREWLLDGDDRGFADIDGHLLSLRRNIHEGNADVFANVITDFMGDEFSVQIGCASHRILWDWARYIIASVSDTPYAGYGDDERLDNICFESIETDGYKCTPYIYFSDDFCPEINKWAKREIEKGLPYCEDVMPLLLAESFEWFVEDTGAKIDIKEVVARYMRQRWTEDGTNWESVEHGIVEDIDASMRGQRIYGIGRK